MPNPFTLSFGKSPLENISRTVQINTILDAFRSDPINQQIFMITGVRGSGKTVLLTEVENRLEKDDNWIVVELNPAADLLSGLAAKLSSHRQCAEIFRRAKINLSFFGFGLSVSGEPPITDLETAIARMLESLKKQDKRVLVAIDEVTSNEYVRVFSAAFQILIRQELPLFLLMTGLYENIEDLQNEKNLTFLYRTPKIKLGPLNMTAIMSRYRSLFHLSDPDAIAMARLTSGYPFAFQALGFLTWEHDGKYQEVIGDYRRYLEEYVYDKLWSELSPKDRQIVYGIAHSESGEIKEIREYLNLSSDQFSPYRARLIRKGIVDGEERGRLRFTLPLFDQYALTRQAFED